MLHLSLNLLVEIGSNKATANSSTLVIHRKLRHKVFTASIRTSLLRTFKLSHSLHSIKYIVTYLLFGTLSRHQFYDNRFQIPNYIFLFCFNPLFGKRVYVAAQLNFFYSTDSACFAACFNCQFDCSINALSRLV